MCLIYGHTCVNRIGYQFYCVSYTWHQTSPGSRYRASLPTTHTSQHPQYTQANEKKSKNFGDHIQLEADNQERNPHDSDI